jgi:molybdate transport system ATP-binding protein
VGPASLAVTLDVAATVHRDGFSLEVDLSVPPGRTVALLGPNGAGKSTLAGVVCGLVPVTAGRVRLDGATLEDPSTGVRVPPARRPVGMLFQDLLLFPYMSAAENVAFPLRARGVGRGVAGQRAHALLEELGVGDRVETPPGALSGGQAQRVALARALVHEPRVLILDEPLSAVDVAGRGRLRALLKEQLARFEGYRLLVTHDPVEAGALADHLVVLERGRVTQEGTPDEIRTAPRTRYVAELVGLNLFAGRLVPLGDGAGRLVTPEGDVVVPWPDRPEEPLEEVLGILHPSDVSLFRSRPEGSARNIVLGRVELVTVEGSRARLRIEGKPPLVAEVTPGSVDRLALREGDRVWAAFKAVEVRLLLP